MGFVAGDLVKETTASTGTGALTLAGAVSGFQTIASIPGIADGDQLMLAVKHQTLAEWETSLCTWNLGAGTIRRDVVLESSNADAPVNFSAGTKDVYCTLPAQSATPATNRKPKGRVVIPPNTCATVSNQYEIPAGVQVEIAADATLEIG